MRPRIALAIVAAFALIVLALAATAVAASQATHPKLLGVVGKNDAFKISLTSKGKVVKTLKAGTYTVVIQDDSTHPQLRARRPARQVVDVHVRRLQGNEDDHAQARERASTRPIARRTSRSCSSTSLSSDPRLARRTASAVLRATALVI